MLSTELVTLLRERPVLIRTIYQQQQLPSWPLSFHICNGPNRSVILTFLGIDLPLHSNQCLQPGVQSQKHIQPQCSPVRLS
jgi:hypothetical protein